MKPKIVFLTEEQIENRDMLVGHFTRTLKTALAQVNNAFRFIRIETPVVVPMDLIQVAPEYTSVYLLTDTALRDQTALGVYNASQEILSVGSHVKYKLPLVLWEYGKVFKNGCEYMNLEYQVLHSNTTATSYLPIIQATCEEMLSRSCGNKTPLVLIRERTDFPGGKNVEVVINMMAALEEFERNKNGRTSVAGSSESGSQTNCM